MARGGDRARMLSLMRARARSEEAVAARTVAKALESLHSALERLGAADQELSAVTVDANEAQYIAMEARLAGREALSLDGLKHAFEGQAQRAAAQAETIRGKAGVRKRTTARKR